MEKLYNLKEMLIKELEEYGKKDKLDSGTINAVDTIAHAVKNLDKVIECEDMGYSGRSYMGHSYRRSYGYDGRSYGYSGHESDEVLEELRNLMATSDERTRARLSKIVRMMQEM